MKTLPADASDSDILSLIYEWMGLLMEERYEEAFHFFVNEEHNLWHWSPVILRMIIQGYGDIDDYQEGNKVTPWEDASEPSRARKDINWYDNNRQRGYIWLDLPLNGEWSDLTAILTLEVMNERLMIELESIEVM